MSRSDVVFSETIGLGQCWKMKRWDLVCLCVALGLDTGGMYDSIISELLVVVWGDVLLSVDRKMERRLVGLNVA